MEVDSLCRRILKDLNHTFEVDPNIEEFDVIPVEDKCLNKSPVIHVEHRLGLESWCIKYVYSFAYDRVMRLRCEKKNLAPHTKWIQNEDNQTEEEQEIDELTKLLLLISPNLSICWSLRKHLIENGYISSDKELCFTQLVLTRKPKSPDTFFHRQWLMCRPDFLPLTDQLIRAELQLCLDAAHRYPRNYSAWTYRNWLLQKWVRTIEQRLENVHQMLSWIDSHVSDYSAYNHLQIQLQEVFSLLRRTQPERIQQLLDDQFNRLKQLSKLYPSQEAIFLHRRFLLNQQVQHRPKDGEINQILNEIHEQEQKFIQHCLKSAQNCTDREWLHTLVKRHKKWLINVLKVHPQ